MEALLPGAPVPVPALTTVAAPAATEDAKVAARSGLYLQLGAFSSRETAENFRARIYKQLTWLSDAMQIVATGGTSSTSSTYRLHLGPYKTQDEARAIADRIQSELSLRPVIVGR